MSKIILPEGWSNCTLADIAEVNPKKIEAEQDIIAGFVPMSHAPTNYNGKLEFEEKTWGEIGKSYTNFKNDDVIFAKVTPCFENGKAAIVKDMPNNIGAGSSEFYVLRARNQEIPASYLLGIIKTRKFMQEGAENMTGAVGLRRVPRAFVESFPLMLPPLAEQKIIADKLDILLAQVDSIKVRLEQIPQILKRFRQAVLVAAVSGNFTEEWRAQNPDQTCTKIVSLGDIIIDGPQNGIYKPSSLYGSGHKIVRIDSFYDGVLCDWNTFKRVQLESSDVQNWSLRNNDILINRVNSIEYLGKCGLVENLPEVTVFESNIMRITLNPEKAVAKFVTIFLSSIIGLSRLRENAKLAVNQASINQKDVKSCKIELPSIYEQTEIVRRVEQLFVYADTIEKQLQNALERVDNLTQSILAKAFRGELTAQWRVENPELISGENSAQSLLVKIQQQLTSIKNIKQRKGKS